MSRSGPERAHPNIWQGTRVRLRGIEPGDAATFFAWNQDTEMARRLYFIPFPTSEERQRRWAEKMATAEPAGDAFHFVIETLGGEMVGSISTHSCEPRHGTFGYGVAVRGEKQRQGYASEAIVLLLRYYFRELRYQKVTAHVYSFNEPSIRLHERLGFQQEGRLRRMIHTDGQYFDELIFGLTAEEFAARYPVEPVAAP